MTRVLKVWNDLTHQKCDGYIQRQKDDFISCETQPPLVLKPFLLWPSEVSCKTRSCLLRNVRQCYKLFINHWFMPTSLFTTEKFGLLDYQDDTYTPSQMNL